MELYKKLLFQIRDMTSYFCINEIYLHWFGEPFLHPNFLEMVKLIVKENSSDKICRALTFHTNATLLNEERISRFLEVINGINFPFSVTLSLDATTPETYNKIRGGGNFETAVRNTKNILHFGKTNPHLKFVLQFIVMDENSNEAEPFVDVWSDYLGKEGMDYKISFNFVPAYSQETHLIYLRQLDGGYKKPTQMRYNQIHSRVRERFLNKALKLMPIPEFDEREIPPGISYHGTTLTPKSFICSNIWDSLAICWEGSATIICEQWLAFNLGNIQHLHLLEMFFNRENLNFLRKKHLSGEIKNNIKDCENCGIVYCEHNGLTNYHEIIKFVESEKRYNLDKKTKPGLGWFV